MVTGGHFRKVAGLWKHPWGFSFFNNFEKTNFCNNVLHQILSLVEFSLIEARACNFAKRTTANHKGCWLETWHTYKVTFCHLIYVKKIPGNCQFLLMTAFFSCQLGKTCNFCCTFQSFISSYQNLITWLFHWSWIS